MTDIGELGRNQEISDLCLVLTGSRPPTGSAQEAAFTGEAYTRLARDVESMMEMARRVSLRIGDGMPESARGEFERTVDSLTSGRGKTYLDGFLQQLQDVRADMDSKARDIYEMNWQIMVSLIHMLALLAWVAALAAFGFGGLAGIQAAILNRARVAILTAIATLLSRVRQMPGVFEAFEEALISFITRVTNMAFGDSRFRQTRIDWSQIGKDAVFGFFAGAFTEAIGGAFDKLGDVLAKQQRPPGTGGPQNFDPSGWGARFDREIRENLNSFVSESLGENAAGVLMGVIFGGPTSWNWANVLWTGVSSVVEQNLESFARAFGSDLRSTFGSKFSDRPDMPRELVNTAGGGQGRGEEQGRGGGGQRSTSFVPPPPRQNTASDGGSVRDTNTVRNTGRSYDDAAKGDGGRGGRVAPGQASGGGASHDERGREGTPSASLTSALPGPADSPATVGGGGADTRAVPEAAAVDRQDRTGEARTVVAESPDRTGERDGVLPPATSDGGSQYTGSENTDVPQTDPQPAGDRPAAQGAQGTGGLPGSGVPGTGGSGEGAASNGARHGTQPVVDPAVDAGDDPVTGLREDTEEGTAAQDGRQTPTSSRDTAGNRQDGTGEDRPGTVPATDSTGRDTADPTARDNADPAARRGAASALTEQQWDALSRQGAIVIPTPSGQDSVVLALGAAAPDLVTGTPAEIRAHLADSLVAELSRPAGQRPLWDLIDVQAQSAVADDRTADLLRRGADGDPAALRARELQSVHASWGDDERRSLAEALRTFSTSHDASFDVLPLVAGALYGLTVTVVQPDGSAMTVGSPDGRPVTLARLPEPRRGREQAAEDRWIAARPGDTEDGGEPADEPGDGRLTPRAFDRRWGKLSPDAPEVAGAAATAQSLLAEMGRFTDPLNDPEVPFGELDLPERAARRLTEALYTARRLGLGPHQATEQRALAAALLADPLAPLPAAFTATAVTSDLPDDLTSSPAAEGRPLIVDTESDVDGEVTGTDSSDSSDASSVRSAPASLFSTASASTALTDPVPDPAPDPEPAPAPALAPAPVEGVAAATSAEVNGVPAPTRQEPGAPDAPTGPAD
ncbi:hypothetical protein, partial [Streptomyces sp. NPDC059762]|uniref:hypothetical protein n=1 Tax=Streptomyces sp. NPDC059762 TaxID=3346938 RepID=UPI0036544D9D